MAHQLTDVLRGIYGLEDASEKGLMALGAASSYLVWEADQLVFEAGRPAEGVFIIVAGSVDIIDTDGSLVAKIDPPHIIGEISTVFGTAHTRTARTTERSELVFVPKQDFDAYMAEHPDQAERLRELIQERLSQA